VEVSAVQFNELGDHENVIEVAGGYALFDSRFDRITFHVKPTDWIIKTKIGNEFPVSDKDFNAQYTFIDTMASLSVIDGGGRIFTIANSDDFVRRVYASVSETGGLSPVLLDILYAVIERSPIDGELKW
jgi:hypothetical protein